MADEQSGTYIIWENGNPKPAYREPFSKSQASQMNVAALSLPYRPIRENGICEPHCHSANEYCELHGEYKPGERAYEGYTRAEVMYMRQADKAAWGDPDAMRNAEDRWIGKPRQEVTTTNINMTFQQWLDALPAPNSVPAQITIHDPQTALIE